MNTTLRTITVSAATVAVLGLAGTATAADLTTPAHHQAVVAVADAGPAAHPAAYVQPVNPATYNTPQQITAQSGAGVAVGGTGIILLSLGVYYAIKKAGHRVGWMFCSFALGVLLAGGALGSMTQTAISSGVNTIATLGGSLS